MLATEAIVRKRSRVGGEEGLRSRRSTNIGTGLSSNSSRNEASRCLRSVMSMRRPMMPPSLVCRSSMDATAIGENLLVLLAGL